jgi:hypothetical protein
VRTGRAHVVGWIRPWQPYRRTKTRRTIPQQCQAIPANRDLGAIRNLGALDARAIHVCAILALEIDDDVTIVFESKLRVRARHALLGVGQDDVVVTAPADLQAWFADLEDLLDTFSADDS